MRPSVKVVAAVVSIAAISGSVGVLVSRGSHDVDVRTDGEGRDLSWSEQRAVQETADAALRDARVALPMLPERLSLVVHFGTSVIPETGETATTVPPAEVVWTVDPARDVLVVVRTQLRASLFHELHHLARASSVRTRSLMDHVVTEGMATAFERDYAKVDPPWGKPPPEAMEWARELFRQPEDASTEEWLIRHPDGRRWIGMRVGTFLVDRACKASGRSPASLVSASTEEVLRLADVGSPLR